MTLEEIGKRIEEIKKEDDEIAHSKEDSLYEEFVEFIANSDSVYAVLAKEILKTKEIDFGRYCS